MKKSSFCSDHFALNCSLCSGDPDPEPTQSIPPAISKEDLASPTIPIEDEVGMGPQPSPISSSEGKSVLSITEEYARACDDYARAVEAVSNIEIHIEKLQNMRTSLQADVIGKKTRKQELKIEVLKTLAD